jgi:hypothetical protein
MKPLGRTVTMPRDADSSALKGTARVSQSALAIPIAEPPSAGPSVNQLIVETDIAPSNDPVRATACPLEAARTPEVGIPTQSEALRLRPPPPSDRRASFADGARRRSGAAESDRAALP